MFLLFLGVAAGAWCQSPPASNAALADRWADSVLATLSLKEQVAQLMVVRVPRNMNKKQQREFEHLVSHHSIGGVCFFAGTSGDQLSQTRRYQQMADVPLLVCIDGEWGLGMRLTDCYSFPRQMLMGALPPEHDSLIYKMGCEVAAQCRKMGIHVDFAPVADLNSNPQNPVIGTRSFGEDRRRVARKATLYANALQGGGVLATAKHFPGHGDTYTDSHLGLPAIDHSRRYMDTVDLYPFRKLIGAGVGGVMVAHLRVGAYDTLRPSSLSPAIVDTLLRGRLGYRGLVFTDGLDMKAVTNSYKAGEAELQALRAGNDILLLPPDPKEAIKAIVHAAHDDDTLRAAIAERCRRVLRAKYRYVVHGGMARLCAPDAADRGRSEQIAYEIAMHGITLIENRGGVLPLRQDAKVLNVFVKQGQLELAPTATAGYDAVVVDLKASQTPGKEGCYGVGADTWSAVARLAHGDVPVVLRIFGSPYVLSGMVGTGILDSLTTGFAVVMAYQDHPQVVQAADALLHKPMTGLLPVTVAGYKAGYNWYTRGSAGQPQAQSAAVDYDARLSAAGMDVAAFRRIDSIALLGIRQKAYPGCQLVVAKGGQVVYNRCYGRQTYDEHSPAVDTATLYDLASLTKVAATTVCVMRLVDAGKVKLDDPLSRYLPYLKHTRHSKITVKQALSHCARLKAFDAYWQQVPLYSRAEADTMEALRVAPSLYVDADSRWQVLNQIAASEPNKKKGYLYSDLGFMLLADMVEHVSGQPIDLFAEQQFYAPLGMATTTFTPLSNGFKPERIAPTEVAEVYRHCALQGYVHDPNAAAMGGVAGHAGLFSSASDLVKLYLMLLAGGEYEGRRYLSPQVIDLFNTRHFAKQGNRRALGYDKPLLSDPSRHCAPQASQRSYGHTGFTGTMVWVDPDYDLVYIFLSNRVYPDARENRLAKLNIRTLIQEEIYKSIEE
ncbi:MAG: serine hydrolase [Bacteroidales bacterium]|nr:serine hydrolase [Bacteroidales bacterium]